MPIRVQAPNGSTVEFPDGTDHATIGKVISENFAAQPDKPELDYGNMPASAVLSHAASNLGSSAAGVAQSVAEPFLHPIETAKNLGHLAYGVGSKAAGYAGIGNDDIEAKAQRESTADAVGQFYSDRYGSVEGFKRAVATDPVGVLADGATALTGFGGAAARLPGAVGRAGAVARDVGRAVDPVRRGGQAVGAVAGTVVPRALSLTTGQGSDVFDTLHAAGKQGGSAQDAAYGHMRETRPRTEIVRMGEAGVKELIDQKSAAYQAGMGPVMASGGQINYQPIDAALAQVESTVKHKGLVKNPDGAHVLKEIKDAVDEFRNKAGSGIDDADALKQRIGNIRDATEEGKPARRVADKAYHAVEQEITKQNAAYRDVNAGYSRDMDELNELRRVLSINGTATDDTTLRKLQSVMRNNAYTSWGHRADLADTLATRGGQSDLPAAIAGQSAAQWEPRGLARVVGAGGALYGVPNMDVATLAALPAFSPRLMGEGAVALGRIQRRLEAAGLPPETINRLLYASGELSQDEPERNRLAPR